MAAKVTMPNLLRRERNARSAKAVPRKALGQFLDYCVIAIGLFV
uniref:Uncharacterized protein n=1 Tax=Pseudomonas aeruginosa TaxID=287 RepID=A0A2L1KFD0_PSEAI|nr:Hypothetical protein [Pseudomonas aeruginosa]